MDGEGDSINGCCGVNSCKEHRIIDSQSVFGRLLSFCALHLFGFDRHNTVTRCLKRKNEKEASRDAWLQTYGLLRSEDMVEEVRELHLLVGYRPVPSSLMYCLRSVFYPTNELLNFWTHFISLLILIHRFYEIAMNLSGPLSDPLYYPFWAYAFGACAMLTGSCIAHVFSCYSCNIREACWFCDYASITLSSFGSTIIYHYYLCPYDCMGSSISHYLQLWGIGGIVGHAICCYSRRMTSKIKYTLRSLVFVFLYIVSFIPCFYLCLSRLASYFNVAEDETFTVAGDKRCHLGADSFVPLLTLVTVFSSATVFFNVSKIPERWYPGTFDIIGHSHQWLHITIALAFYSQTYLIESPLLEADALRMTEPGLVDELQITWWGSIGSMAAVGTACLATSAYATWRLYNTSAKSRGKSQ